MTPIAYRGVCKRKYVIVGELSHNESKKRRNILTVKDRQNDHIINNEHNGHDDDLYNAYKGDENEVYMHDRDDYHNSDKDDELGRDGCDEHNSDEGDEHNSDREIYIGQQFESNEEFRV